MSFLRKSANKRILEEIRKMRHAISESSRNDSEIVEIKNKFDAQMEENLENWTAKDLREILKNV